MSRLLHARKDGDCTLTAVWILAEAQLIERLVQEAPGQELAVEARFVTRIAERRERLAHVDVGVARRLLLGLLDRRSDLDRVARGRQQLLDEVHAEPAVRREQAEAHAATAEDDERRQRPHPAGHGDAPD
jgi:hypothetical protein